MFDRKTSAVSTLFGPRRSTPFASVDLGDVAALGATSLRDVLTTFRLWGGDAYYEGAVSFGDALLQRLFSNISYGQCRHADAAAVERVATLCETAYRHSPTFRDVVDRTAEADTSAHMQHGNLVGVLALDGEIVDEGLRTTIEPDRRTSAVAVTDTVFPRDDARDVADTEQHAQRDRAMLRRLMDVLSVAQDESSDPTPQDRGQRHDADAICNVVDAVLAELSATPGIGDRFALMAATRPSTSSTPAASRQARAADENLIIDLDRDSQADTSLRTQADQLARAKLARQPSILSRSQKASPTLSTAPTAPTALGGRLTAASSSPRPIASAPRTASTALVGLLLPNVTCYFVDGAKGEVTDRAQGKLVENLVGAHRTVSAASTNASGQSTTLARMKTDYHRQLRRVDWILRYAYLSPEQRRQHRLLMNESRKLLVEKQERTLLPDAWQFLLDVWRQSASAEALARWGRQMRSPRLSFDRVYAQPAGPSSSSPASLPIGLPPAVLVRRKLDDFAMPDAWFDACFTVRGELTSYAYQLCRWPVRTALCERIQKAFIQQCPTQMIERFGRLPNWPVHDLALRLPLGQIAERDDPAAAPTPDGEGQTTLSTASGLPAIASVRAGSDMEGDRPERIREEPDDTTRFVRTLLYLHELTPSDWPQLSTTPLDELFSVAKTIVNYVNRSEGRLTSVAWTYLLGAWWRSAMLAATTEMETRWKSKATKSRAAFARLLVQVMNGYGLDALADCFDMSGERTRFGARHRYPIKSTVSDALCLKIRRAVGQHAERMNPLGHTPPTWPAWPVKTAADPSAPLSPWAVDAQRHRPAASSTAGKLTSDTAEKVADEAAGKVAGEVTGEATEKPRHGLRRPSDDPLSIHDQSGGSDPKARRIGDPETVGAGEEGRQVAR